MDELILNKCMNWMDDGIKEHYSLVNKEDDSTYHQRIYLVAWNDDYYTHAYIIRAFTGDDGKNINISQDYEIHVIISDFVNYLPDIHNKISEFKTKF